MCIKSEFKEICLKLATNGQSDKGFLLMSKVCPKRVFCPCPGAIYMYRIIKNVYKIRFGRDHFETCSIWAKRKGLSGVIKILSPRVVCPCPGSMYIYKSIKIYTKFDPLCFYMVKSVRKSFNGRNLQQMTRVTWGLCLHKNSDPRGLSAPVLGLYTCIKNYG